MTKNSIFNVDATSRTINQIQLEELIGFVLKYRSVIILNDTRSMLATRALIETPINKLYEKYIVSGKDRLFSFIKVLPDIPAPEVITYTHVTFDTKQIRPVSENLYKAVTLVPELSNRILFNITSLTKKNNELNNIGLFQSLFVRDLLSRSFFMTNDVWLPPSTLQYLCKTYSMSVAVAISSVYNLSYPEQQMIATIFGLFFLSQIHDINIAEILLKNSNKFLVGSNAEIGDVIAKMKDTLGDRYKNMSLNDACECVRNLGISRLNEISRRFLLTKLKNAGPDTITTAIALEYPPYWLYLVLLAGSGQKIGLSFTLKKANLLKDVDKLADDLLKNQSMLSLMI